MNNFSAFSAYIGIRLLCVILTTLPLRVTYLLAETLGSLAFLFGFRRRVVLENLKGAFGSELDDDALRSLAARSYQQTVMTFLELLVAPKLQSRGKDILAPEQTDLIHRLLARGNGLVTISGHLGNWELQGAAAAAVTGGPFTVAAKRQSNPYIDRFITARRNGLGMEVVDTRRGMKLLLRALKKGEAVGLVADQHAGRGGIVVNFFGRPAATHPGPAQLAIKFKAPLLVGAAIRKGPGEFTVIAREVEITDDDTVETLTKKHVRILEEFIRQYPEQYFWMHRRWKVK